MESGPLHFLGYRFTGQELTLIQEIIRTCDGLSRMELARTVCELLGWKRRTAKLKARECREFLETLESKGLLALPEKRMYGPPGRSADGSASDRTG